MPTTTDYIEGLRKDKTDLVANLKTKGVTDASDTETFTSLVPKVLNIPSGGGESFSKQYFIATYMWQNNSYTIDDEFFKDNKYSFVVAPYPDYINEYSQAGVYSDIDEANGSIAFTCKNVPTKDLIVNVLKIEAKQENELDPHTLLLLHADDFEDSSIYNVPLINNGVTVSTTQSKFGGKSFYFNGNSVFTIPTQTFPNDFTIDCWLFLQANNKHSFICGGSKGSLFIGSQYPNNAKFGFGRVNIAWDGVNGDFPLNSWHHMALCRSNNTIKLFIDGVEKISKQEKLNYSLFMFGGDGVGNNTIGYMDEIRISDIARWTSNFTPPTKPYIGGRDEHPKSTDTNTLLLLHADTYYDSSKYNVPLTNNGVKVSNVQSKFGGKSFYFNGDSNILYLSKDVPLHTLDNFTLDWWEFCEAGSKVRFSQSWDNWGGLLLGYDNGIKVFAGTSANSWNLIKNTTMFNVTPNQWVHWAFVKNGNTAKTYRNGVQFATTTMNGKIWAGQNRASIGGYYKSSPEHFKGYIDEFRISNIARWTSNFTPPVKPYE